MNTLHKEILQEIKREAENPSRSPESEKYHGNSHHHFFLSVPVTRKIAQDWAHLHKTISPNDLCEVVTSLFMADSYEEKTMGGKLLEYLPHVRTHVSPAFMNVWLEYVEGWAEIDSLCQGTFSADNILSRWKEWKKVLIEFSNDKNIAKRRASLVLLTKPVTQSPDPRLVRLALENVHRLKGEKDILITKAISWILRSLIKHHKAEVSQYLEQNKQMLPNIAVRETEAKLSTGKKYIRSVQ